MNSPLEIREVRLRGLVRCGEVPRAAATLPGEWQVLFRQLKPRAVCEAFRGRCGGFSRSRPMPAPKSDP